MTDFAIFTGINADTDATQLERDCHKLFGGDRAETGAVGVGPIAVAWLAANGPPITTGYTTPVDAGTETRVIITPELIAELAVEDARPANRKLLTSAERTRLGDAVTNRQIRTSAGATK